MSNDVTLIWLTSKLKPSMVTLKNPICQRVDDYVVMGNDKKEQTLGDCLDGVKVSLRYLLSADFT